MILKDDKEEHNTIASQINYNPINDKIQIMHKQRKNMNFKVIDDNINEIDHSHQNVDITKGQSELSLSLIHI